MGKVLLSLVLLLSFANKSFAAKTSIYESSFKPYPSPALGLVKPKESQVDKYIDQFADRVAPGVIGNIIGGPAGLAIKLAAKIDAGDKD